METGAPNFCSIALLRRLVPGLTIIPDFADLGICLRTKSSMGFRPAGILSRDIKGL